MAHPILLTGAGFTHNFGAPLAEGMWAKIFSHPEVQRQWAVRELMLDDFDYESIYNKIINGEIYSSDNKEAIKTAILDAYKSLDIKISHELDQLLKSNRRENLPNLHNMFEFIRKFLPELPGCNDKGFFFTLNQDLFVERHSYNHGVSFLYPENVSNGNNNELFKKIKDIDGRPLESFAKIPDGNTVRKAKVDFNNCNRALCYVKLHGSYGLLSSQNSNMMVIGQDKEESISREPLLAWYLEIFKEALGQQGVKLLVIGYGFRDRHINKIIADSIKENGLELYVLSPESPKEFSKKFLPEKPRQYVIVSDQWESIIREQIYDGLRGYFPYSLLQVFPKDQPKTEECKEIERSLYG